MIPQAIDGMQMERVIDLQSGRESRQDVVRNDRISLGDFAPRHWLKEGGV